MILEQYKIRRFNTKKKIWDILLLNQKEYLELLESKYQLPGDYNFDSRISNFLTAKEQFLKAAYYCTETPDTPEFEEWWNEEAMKCVHGVMVDEFFITGLHYFYVNFLKINDKVRKKSYFPDYWDSDVWYFYCRDIAQLKGLDLAIIKKRQWGSSFKLAAGAIHNVWFFREKITKVFSADKKHLLGFWNFMEDYRDFLNEHTNWYREFNPNKKLDWKQQQSITLNTAGGNKEVNQGRKGVIQGVATDRDPFAIVAGKVDEYIAEESGKNRTLDQSVNAAQEAMKFGNIKTGFLTMSGAVGELIHAAPAKKYIFNPDENKCLSFPNIWSNRPEERVGMFVPSYYSYGNCIDQFGNSLVEQAKAEIEKELLVSKKKSIKDYLVQLSQMPSTLEDAFGEREENIFPTEIIQPYYDRLIRQYEPIYVSLIEEAGKIIHVPQSTVMPVLEYPMKKSTDRRGCVCIVEPPIENAPLGIYYAGVDTISEVRTDTSESLQSIYIFRADYYDNDMLVPGQMVAWYTGRYQNSEITYNITRMLIKYYGALSMVESDNRGFLTYMINKKQTLLLLKQSQYPKLSIIVPNSKVHENFGIRKGNSKAFEDHLLNSLIAYVKEEIEVEQGYGEEDKTIFGVERIKDVMLLKEMLVYNTKGNFDRLWAFAYALNVAEGMTDRNRIVKIREKPKEQVRVQRRINQFGRSQTFNYL